MGFTQEDVQAVCRYMNTGMESTNLFIVQRLTVFTAADSAQLVGITPACAQFLITEGEAQHEVEVAWEHQVDNRADMKTELFALLDKAQRVTST